MLIFSIRDIAFALRKYGAGFTTTTMAKYMPFEMEFYL